MIINEKHFSRKVYDFHKEDRMNLELNLLSFLDIEKEIVLLPETTKSLLKLKINKDNLKENHTLYLNKLNSKKENNTLIFINCSKYIFKYREYTLNQKIEIDSFELSEIKKARFSKVIQLATRLAISEKDIIFLLNNEDKIKEYSDKYNLLEPFVKSILSNSNLKFILGIEDLIKYY